MTIDDWRARYDHLNAEADRLRAEVERLREDAARARWCEENKADVVWDWRGNQWRCETAEDMWMDQHRNAAIDYVRTGVPFWQSTAVEAERDAARAGEARAVECIKEIDEYNGGADSVLEDEYVTHRRMEVIEGGASSLAWLARQRREAVAAWIEKEATKCRQQNGEYYDRGVDCMLREAAALRAGEVEND